MTRSRQASTVFRMGLVTSTVAGLGVGAVALHRWWRRERDDDELGLAAVKEASAGSHAPASASPEASLCPADSAVPEAVEAEADAHAAVEEDTPPASGAGEAGPAARPEEATAASSLVDTLRPESASASSESSSEWSRAEEVRRLAENALEESAGYFDDHSSSWSSSSSSEDGVHLSSMPKQNSRLPIFRGVMDIPAEKAPRLDDIAQVMLSHSCRRFYDQLYKRGEVLANCGNGTALVCNFFKPSPIAGRLMAVGAFGARRHRTGSTGNGGTSVRERLTVAIGTVPDHIVEPFSARLSELAGDQSTIRSDCNLWALDALVREDGTLRVGFLTHSDLSSLKVPAFLLRKIMASAPAQPLTQIVMMASVGMTPQHTVALAGPEPEETEERVIQGQTVRCSTLFHDIFTNEAT